MGFTDLTGMSIPPDRIATASGVDRILAVPPVRDVPNEQAIEFTLSGFANLAAGGAAFVQLTDFTTGQPVNAIVPPLYRGRLSSLLIYCPDMVTAAAPYLSFQMLLNGQVANAWGLIPVFPRSGVASLSFDMSTDLSPQQSIQLWGKNTDAVNTHFVGVYLYGWFWPKDLQQG